MVFGFRMGPKSSDRCPYEEKAERWSWDSDTQRGRPCGDRSREWSDAWITSHKTPGATSNCKARKNLPPKSLWREHTLLTPWCWTSGLQDCNQSWHRGRRPAFGLPGHDSDELSLLQSSLLRPESCSTFSSLQSCSLPSSFNKCWTHIAISHSKLCPHRRLPEIPAWYAVIRCLLNKQNEQIGSSWKVKTMCYSMVTTLMLSTVSQT